MPPENNGNGHAPDERELQQILERAGVPSDKTGLDRIRWLADEVTRLAPLAADGTTYRAEVRTTALAEAVRALGAEHGQAQQAMIDASPIAVVTQLASAWRQIGDARLPGGRSSSDEPANDDVFVWKPVKVGGLSQS